MRKAVIIQREFAHDIARVTLPREAPTFPDYRSNNPVELEYGWADDSAKFFGYVHHVEPALDRTGAYLTVVCIGASYPLKQRRQHLYRDMSASDVAQTIADRHRLDADIEPHTLVRSVITQAGESDWELLVRLAHDIGYVVFANETQLRFHTRTRDIDGMRDSAPRFRYESSESALDQGDVREFKSKIGETLPQAGRRADRRAYGVDPDSADLIEVRNNGELADVLGVETADPFFDYYEQSLVIHSQDDGEVALDGITEDNRFHISATADVRGNVRVRQAMPVYFDKLPEDFGGYWFVHAVTHSIGDGAYMMDLELGRDSLQIADELPTGRPKRDLSFLPTAGKPGGGGGPVRLGAPGRANPVVRKPGTTLRSPTAGGKAKPAKAGGKPKPKTTRTPVKGKGKVTSKKPKVTAKKAAPSKPPRGARKPTPPKPVRSTVPRPATRQAPIVTAKPAALWQATHRSQPIRVAAPKPKPAAVAQRLSKVAVRGR